MNTKECSKCREVKDLSDFYKSKKGLLGRDSRCKRCKYESSSKAKSHNRRASTSIKFDKQRFKFCSKCESVLDLGQFHKGGCYCRSCESNRKAKPTSDLLRKGARLSNETNKWCPTCQSLLDRSQFYKNRTSKDGLRSECKSCHNTREKNKRCADPSYKLRTNVSRAIRYGLSGDKGGSNTFEHLPYTPKQLREHLEAQFDEHMTWENYGDYWHVDHIYPQSLLPYDSYDDPNFQKCWALENLQPLEAIENLKKSNKII